MRIGVPRETKTAKPNVLRAPMEKAQTGKAQTEKAQTEKALVMMMMVLKEMELSSPRVGMTIQLGKKTTSKS
jgi:hypothetical protein